ncbi:MAG TPA: DUF6520 family protein [Puia sp.]|jgi:hypothetical protein|nr:DUF6520 family protein [Puia sp.]
MKRKNIFIAAAFILAIGSAFTSKHGNNLIGNGYIKPNCNQAVVTCNNFPGVACTFMGAQAYSDQTTCTVALTRSLP